MPILRYDRLYEICAFNGERQANWWVGDLACGRPNETLETIPGERISPDTGGGGFGSYCAGLFEDRHVALRVACDEVCRVCDLVKDQCMVEIARLGQDSEDPEYDCRFTFWHGRPAAGYCRIA